MTKLWNDQIIDLDYLREISGHDSVFEQELFTLFKGSSKANIEKMEKALAENDDESWHSAAHSLKGSCGSVGAFFMTDVLAYAQLHSKDKAEDKKLVLADIKTGLAKVYDFIEKEILK